MALRQPQDVLLVGKGVGRGVAVTATADSKPGHLALLKDKSEGRSYLGMRAAPQGGVWCVCCRGGLIAAVGGTWSVANSQ